MPFNKLKNKLSELAGNETLGSAEVEVEEVVEHQEEDYTPDLGGNYEEGIEDVLAILNISEKANANVPFTANDLAYIEFTQTTPVGFDFDEVADFVERMQYVLILYENALRDRDEDVLKLASEVKKIEKKLVTQNQDKQLEMMMGGASDEELLRDENFQLKLEVESLKEKVRTLSSSTSEINNLKEEIKSLRSENEFLRLDQAKSKVTVDEAGLPVLEKSTKKAKIANDDMSELPSLDDILGPAPSKKTSGDPMDDMLDSMKGEF